MDATDQPTGHAAVAADDDSGLPQIPQLRCGTDFPAATLTAFPEKAAELMTGATASVPTSALKLADQISRKWLVKSGNAHLAEIDGIAEQLGRPGAYFLSINYEWGCTVAVRPTSEGAELVRVLDWRTPGLGRHVVAAEVDGPAGPFVTLTWPGYTGVLQAMAPGRFAAALNQAPMPRRGGGLMPLDWLANKVDVWRSRAATPAHLLRDVVERAAHFDDAVRQLAETPIAAPAIFSVAGCRAQDVCIIERSERDTELHHGARATANAWMAPNWSGRPRGVENTARTRQLAALRAGATTDFAWLSPPVLNPTTRLAAIFNASCGQYRAQGYAGESPATAVLTAHLASN